MTELKQCISCGEEKSTDSFTKRKASKDGLHPYCKSCVKEMSITYRKNNIEKIKQYDKDRSKLDKRKQAAIEYRKSNQEQLNEKSREWYHNNKERVLKRKLERYHELYYTNTQFRMDRIIRRSIGRMLELSKTSKTTATYHDLGYRPIDLIKHIENLFTDGMNWDNYGQWHIDHITSIHEFISNGINDKKIINALSNLRPVWANDNLRKGHGFELVQQKAG